PLVAVPGAGRSDGEVTIHLAPGRQVSSVATGLREAPAARRTAQGGGAIPPTIAPPWPGRAAEAWRSFRCTDVAACLPPRPPPPPHRKRPSRQRAHRRRPRRPDDGTDQ